MSNLTRQLFLAIQHLRRVDPVMAGLVARFGSCSLIPKRTGSPFESLAESITYQQIQGGAAASIWSKVLKLYGGKHLGTPEQVLKTHSAKLRNAGLSKAKLDAIKDLARHAVNGHIPDWQGLERLSDGQVIETLTRVRGVGPWTAQMLLIFSMGRLDVLPSSDFGVLEGFRKAYNKRNKVSTATLEKAAKVWSPYRTVAAWYLWRAADSAAKSKS